MEIYQENLYTYNVQTQIYKEKTFSQKYICLYGMVEFMKRLLEEQRSPHRFSILLNIVKVSSLKKRADYDLKILKMTCTDVGDKCFDPFHVSYYNKCVSDNYPEFLQKFKDHQSENPKIEHIQEYWVKLSATDKGLRWYAEYCGRLLPNELNIIAAHSNRKYILLLIEHAKKQKLTIISSSVKKTMHLFQSFQYVWISEYKMNV